MYVSKNEALYYKMKVFKDKQKWEMKAFGFPDFAGDEDKRLRVTDFCVSSNEIKYTKDSSLIINRG